MELDKPDSFTLNDLDHSHIMKGSYDFDVTDFVQTEIDNHLPHQSFSLFFGVI